MKKDDSNVFRAILKILQYFGMAPMNFEARYPEGISVFVLILSSALSVISIRIIIGPETTTYSSSFIMIANCAQCLFVVYCIIFTNFVRRKCWLELRVALMQMEKITRDWKSTESNLSLYLQLLAIYTSFISTFVLKIYTICVREFIPPLLLVTFTKFLGLLYVNFLITFYATITHYLNVKCAEMKRALWTDPKGQVINVTRSYKMMKEIVDVINRLLGQLVFLTICILCMEILNSILFFIEMHSEFKDSSLRMFSNLWSPTRFIIPLLIVVMTCDSLEKSGKDLVKTCYILHEKTDMQRVKEELFLLAECMEELPPTVSAAGFYSINQYCLSSIFTAIITHLVIILQLDVLVLSKLNSTESIVDIN